jgi:hypothetical protein
MKLNLQLLFIIIKFEMILKYSGIYSGTGLSSICGL